MTRAVAPLRHHALVEEPRGGRVVHAHHDRRFDVVHPPRHATAPDAERPPAQQREDRDGHDEGRARDGSCGSNGARVLALGAAQDDHDRAGSERDPCGALLGLQRVEVNGKDVCAGSGERPDEPPRGSRFVLEVARRDDDPGIRQDRDLRGVNDPRLHRRGTATPGSPGDAYH